MCFSIYSGNWKTGGMKVWHTPTPRKFEFSRAISGAEYFAVEAETAEEALKILNVRMPKTPMSFRLTPFSSLTTRPPLSSINPKKEVSK